MPVFPDPDERQLVVAVLRKDRKATAALVDRVADPVHAYVRHRLAPRTDLVDDLVQEVFLAAIKGLPSFSGRSSLRSWILGIARHKVEDHYRAHLRRVERTGDLKEEVTEERPFVPLEESMDHERLERKTRRVLARLPEAYAYALLWRYWERRSLKDIAAATGRTEKAAERLLARARQVPKAVGRRVRGIGGYRRVPWLGGRRNAARRRARPGAGASQVAGVFESSGRAGGDRTAAERVPYARCRTAALCVRGRRGARAATGTREVDQPVHGLPRPPSGRASGTRSYLLAQLSVRGVSPRVGRDGEARAPLRSAAYAFRRFGRRRPGSESSPGRARPAARDRG